MKMPYCLIGVGGYIGHGKSTLGKMLEQLIGARLTHFADPLKEEVGAVFGIADIWVYEDRAIKALPVAEFSLARCKDPQFVEFALGFMDELSGQDEPTNVPLSPRRIYQVYGTEYRRRHPVYGIEDYWLNQFDNHVMSDPGYVWVASDMRFHLEYDYIKSMGGLYVRVVMEGEPEPDPSTLHVSETELLDVTPDVVLINRKDDLAFMENQIVDKLLPLIGANRHAYLS